MEKKIMSRRALLSSGAVIVAGAALAGCSSTGTTGTTWASIVGEIQGAVATAASYIPTVESIAATAAGLFGPQYSALVSVGSAAFNQIVATLTNVVTSLSPPAAARLMARLAASSPQVPVAIGVTSIGTPVNGYRLH